VIHLVTAADGAPDAYVRSPTVHRPESPQEAIALDRWLAEAWGGHLRCRRINNVGRDWVAARVALAELAGD